MAGIRSSSTSRAIGLACRTARGERRSAGNAIYGGSIIAAIPKLSPPLAPSPTSLIPRCPRRAFQSSACCLKKGGNKSTAPTPTPTAAEGDPFDFSELTEDIAKAHTALKDGLSKLRSGGRFNPEVVENLRATVDRKSDEPVKSKETVRLGDLAQCVLRGRVLNIMVGEKDHVKPIVSAMQSSNLNLNPQTDSQNPLQVNIQLPPPTTESREQSVKTAVDLAGKASTAIRNARAAQQKRHQTMLKKKSARPDDLNRASTKWEKLVLDGTAEVKKILDSAKKVLES